MSTCNYLVWRFQNRIAWLNLHIETLCHFLVLLTLTVKELTSDYTYSERESTASVLVKDNPTKGKSSPVKPDLFSCGAFIMGRDIFSGSSKLDTSSSVSRVGTKGGGTARETQDMLKFSNRGETKEVTVGMYASINMGSESLLKQSVQ